MKFVFVLPDMSWLYDYKSQFSLGILYLSSVIKKYGHHVEIYDTNVHSIEDIGKYDVYAFSVVTPTYENSVDLAKHIRIEYPDVKIIIGGVHITLDPENIDDVFDTKFIGESEDCIIEYINDIENNIHKKLYSQSNKICLDGLVPDRLLLEDSYVRTGSIFTGGKTFDENGSTSIMFSRGCPYKCAFCASPKIYDGVRFRNVDEIIDEVKYIINTYGIRQFRVQDDTFTLKKSFLRELCGKLKPLNIYYRCSTRVNHVDEESIKLLYDSGCREIGIGVEVANNEALKLLQKGITVEMVENAIMLIRKYPIIIRCFFMIGLPFDSKEIMQDNIDFLERNKIENAVFCNLIPLKGTDLYDNKEKYNIKSIDENGCMNLASHIPLQPNIERTDITKEEHLAIMKPFFEYLIQKKFIH